MDLSGALISMTSGNSSYFVDANVLVYAALKDDSRHEVSKALLKDAGRGPLHLSPQVLAEFYSTVTNSKRVTVPYSPPEAIEFIETSWNLYAPRSQVAGKDSAGNRL